MKLGMVFEGGASRTIFSCGVADAFLEENIMPDYFIGVSAGIAFGLSYLSKQHGRNLELARKYMSDGNYQGLSSYLIRTARPFIIWITSLMKCQINYCPLIMMHLQHFRDRWKQQ